jgi:hypothetical protein
MNRVIWPSGDRVKCSCYSKKCSSFHTVIPKRLVLARGICCLVSQQKRILTSFRDESKVWVRNESKDRRVAVSLRPMARSPDSFCRFCEA